MLLVLALINFLIYFLLTLKFNNKSKILLSFIFIFFSVLFKLNVEVSDMPDYDAYYDVIGLIKPELSFKMLFAEPYYFQLVNYLYKYNSAEFSINFFYYLNFLFTLIFFIWIAFLRDINSWKKVLLYGLYYFLFAFVLLRNTPSYVLTGFLFYYLHQNKYIKITLLSFLGHLSSLPILIFSMFKNKIGDNKLFIYILLYFFSFNLILNLPFLGVYEKFNMYQDVDEYGKSIFHKIYFVFFICINIYLFFKNKIVVYNYTYVFIFMTYFFLQLASPIMGFRFSVYLIIYLLLNPKFSFNYIIETRLNVFLPAIILVLFVFNYYSIFS